MRTPPRCVGNTERHVFVVCLRDYESGIFVTSQLSLDFRSTRRRRESIAALARPRLPRPPRTSTRRTLRTRTPPATTRTATLNNTLIDAQIPRAWFMTFQPHGHSRKRTPTHHVLPSVRVAHAQFCTRFRTDAETAHRYPASIQLPPSRIHAYVPSTQLQTSPPLLAHSTGRASVHLFAGSSSVHAPSYSATWSA